MFIENVRIALKSIRTNLLRSILTIFIIAFGIMALVGILTAIDAIKFKLTESFSLMGANTFTIESRGMRVHIGNESYRRKNYEFISFKQAEEFKDRFRFPAAVSVWTQASGSAIVKYQSYKSNPNTTVIGVDDQYIYTAGYEIEKGRNFTETEIDNNASIVLIGSDLARQAFGNNIDPLNRFISVGNGRYRVVGVLKSKGAVEWPGIGPYLPGPLHQCPAIFFKATDELFHQCEAHKTGDAGDFCIGSRGDLPACEETGCQGRE
jgi:putative ABC transport system permease protein